MKATGSMVNDIVHGKSMKATRSMVKPEAQEPPGVGQKFKTRALTSSKFLNRVVGGHYSIRSRVFFFISKDAKTNQSEIKRSCLLSKQTYHKHFL